MRREKKILGLSAVVMAMAMGVTGGVLLSNQTQKALGSAEEPVTWNLKAWQDSGDTASTTSYLPAMESSGSAWGDTITTDIYNPASYEVSFVHCGVYHGDQTGYLEIYDYGYFYNLDRITSINSVTVTFQVTNTSTSLLVYEGWQNEWHASEEAATLGEAGKVAFKSSPTSPDTEFSYVASTNITATYTFSNKMNYIKFAASGGQVNISSIVYDYDCSETSNTVKFAQGDTLRIKTVGAPTYGGAALTDDQYVWMGYFIPSDATQWVNSGGESGYNWVDPVRLTEDTDGTWYYDHIFSKAVSIDTLTDGVFQATFYIGTADSFEWSDTATNLKAASFTLSQGQTEIIVYAPTFDAPSENGITIVTNFTFTSATSYTNIQILYSDSDFSSSSNTGSWSGDIASAWSVTAGGIASTNEFTLPNTYDEATTIYLAGYVWYANRGEYLWDSDWGAVEVSVSAPCTVTLTGTFTGVEGTNTWDEGSTNLTASVSTSTDSDTSGTAADYTVEDITTTVYENMEGVSPSILYNGTEVTDYTLEVVEPSLDNVNLRIDNNKIVALKGGTTTEVKATIGASIVKTFNVTVNNSEYSQNYSTTYSTDDFESTEGWFNTSSVTAGSSSTEGVIAPISSMTSSFANGIDISSAYVLYENGANYFTTDGTEQSLFYLLKDNGVNWIRLRLWVEPYETYAGGTLDYGAGSCDYEAVEWMAHEAHMAGLDVLLDFHYSDFWAHADQQVIPKSWSDCTTVDALASKVTSYTKETLVNLYNADALPTMVQIGNETMSGMLAQTTSYSANSTSNTTIVSDGTPYYVSKISDSSIGGSYSASNYSNLATYLSAGCNGVNNAVSEIGSDNVEAEIGSTSIKKMIHYNFGGTGDRFNNSNVITYCYGYYNNLRNVDFDVIGLSAYPFYDFPNDFISFNSGLSSLTSQFNKNSTLSSKEVMIAETSSPFTSAAWNDYTASSYSTNSTSNGFGISVAGQAQYLHDFTEDVIDNGGTGVFWWEGAWLPIAASDGSGNAAVGWGTPGTKATWWNQSFFSMGGKATVALRAYDYMNPTFSAE